MSTTFYYSITNAISIFFPRLSQRVSTKWATVAVVLSIIAFSQNLVAAEIARSFTFPITSEVDYRIDQGFLEWYSENFEFHLGEDWNKKTGGNSDCDKPVNAIANGTIVFAADVGGTWGNVIIIRHDLPDGSQIESMYGHLRRMIQTIGDVTVGQQIGDIGDGNGGETTVGKTGLGLAAREEGESGAISDG